MKEKLKEFCRSLGIEYTGIAPPGPYHELEQRWRKRIEQGQMTGFEEKDISRRIDARCTLEDAASVIVCLFPYYTGPVQGANLSKSVFSRDYHVLVKEKLEQIGQFLKGHIAGFEYRAFVDSGPLVDRYMAYLAGLGFFGVNGHIITDRYGSYVFIGYLINNYPFAYDQPQNRTCLQCGNCRRSCPGSAIPGNFDISPLRCRSFLTQKKGELTAEEEGILQKDSLVFGCDICQDVCPHNRNIEMTPLQDFQQHLVTRIEPAELEHMSNREFLRKYGNYNFSWRGKNLLQRNFRILQPSRSASPTQERNGDSMK